jgi:hypothetical protein
MPPETKKPFKPDLTLADKLVGLGLNLYGKNVNREELPLNKRIFLESVVDARKDPITEASMREPERQALMSVVLNKYERPAIKSKLSTYERYLANALKEHKQAVAEKNKDKQMRSSFVALFNKDLNAIRQFRKGAITQDFIDLTSGGLISNERLYGLTKSGAGIRWFTTPSIGYEDYPIDASEDRSVFVNRTPEALEQTLGRIAYTVDPKTKQLVFKEEYDFNPIPPDAPSSTEAALAATPEGGGGPLYRAIRLYAGKVLPPGQGRPVNIRLNQLSPPPQNALITR